MKRNTNKKQSINVSDQQNKRKPQPRKRKWWHKLINPKKLVGGLIAFLGLVGGIINTTQTQIGDDFEEFYSYGGAMEVDYANLYSYCAQELKYNRKPTIIDSPSLLTMLHSLSSNHSRFINAYKKLGQLVTKDTYDVTHELACWIDNIAHADISPCALKLKSRQNMDKWRDKVLKQIKVNQNEQQQIINVIYYLFKKLSDNPRNKLYPNPGCDLEKINAY